jgi:hypothetical protein
MANVKKNYGTILIIAGTAIDVNPDFFKQLQVNDILFIDSSYLRNRQEVIMKIIY